MNTKTANLYCEVGKHHWDRPAQRGKKPHNCPEHAPIKIKPSSMNGLEKARLARQKKKMEEENLMTLHIEEIISNPSMPFNSPVPEKLRYIQQQLTKHRAERTPHDLSEFERMREIILKTPYSTSGHLF